MKILFVGDGLLDTDLYPLVNAGASVQTWGVCRALAKRGHEVTILKRSDVSQEEEIVEGVNLVGIKLKGQIMSSTPFVLHFAQITSALYFSLRSIKLIDNIRPNCLCLMSRYSGFFPSGLKMPIVYIMHSPDALGYFKAYSVSANILNSVLFYFKKSIENRIMNNSACVIVLNKYNEKYLKTRGITCVERIPNGIDADTYSNKGDENYVLYAGRFDWNKNVISLVKVFSEIVFGTSKLRTPPCWSREARNTY